MSSSSRRTGVPAAVVLSGDVLKWVLPRVARFPKTYRFGLGARIEGALTDVLEGLVTAQYSPGREHLVRANARLQVARHLARLASELELLSPKQHLHLVTMLDDLGRQVGGWQRSSGETATSSRG